MQRTHSIERTRSIESKSAFIAAAAGLAATATVPTVANDQFWFIGLLPLGLAVLTVVYAARALWPKPLDVPGARLLVDTYVDAEMTGEALEDHLLEVLAVEIEERDRSNDKRTESMKLGFKLLSCSLAALIVVAALNGTILKGNTPDAQETNAPSPTKTPD